MTLATPDASCPLNAAPGAHCQRLIASCEGMADIGLTIGVAEPTDPAADAVRGTIVLHSGGQGTNFFNLSVANLYLTAGFRTVQIAWDTGSDWQSANNRGAKDGACRPATLNAWLREHVHHRGQGGFCGQGHSGGSGALMYSMAHYGQEDIFDYVLLTQGPPPGRMDYGCYPPAYRRGVQVGAWYTVPMSCTDENGNPYTLAAPYSFAPSRRPLIDSWAGTHTCGQVDPRPPAQEIRKWRNTSVDSPGADFHYPRTGMSFWFCATNPNESAGLGWFVARKVRQLGSRAPVHCDTRCAVEGIYGDAAEVAVMAETMAQNCIDRHREAQE